LRLEQLHEGILPEPRSSLSGRITALREKSKTAEKAAVKAGMGNEIEHVNNLIVRAKKNKLTVLASKILSKAEEKLNSVITKLMKYDTMETRRSMPRQDIKDTAKRYMDKLPARESGKLKELGSDIFKQI